jgi:uncharacterized protein
MAGGGRGHHDQLSQLPWTSDGDGVRVAVRVTPRAKRSAFAGLVDTGDGRVALAVKLAAPPVDGAANEALVAFLAEHFGLSRSSVSILSGEKARLKIVRFAGLSAEALSNRLMPKG